MPLYISYANKCHTDGAGSQLQRKISIFLIAKYYNVKYYDVSIIKLDYKGLVCMVSNTEDDTQLPLYNELFSIPNEEIIFDKILYIQSLSEAAILYHKTSSENILLVGVYGHEIIDYNVDILSIGSPQWDWVSTTLKKPINVAVHVRRGELRVVDSHRMLDKKYYLKCMEHLKNILDNHSIPYEFHIYGECNADQTIITPTHHGIFNRIKEPIILEPDINYFDDFIGENVFLHINDSPVKTLIDLINSDCLVASRSSFSYVAAIVKKKGCVIFPKFWHGLSKKWIEVDPFIPDIMEKEEYIVSLLT